jgi:predicted enzyme related to lactoylglutathione lyase
LGEQIVTVTQGFLRAPESTDIVFVEPAAARGTAAWDADPDRHYTELTSVVCHVPDFEAETAFWGADGLGLDAWYDVSFTDPGLDEMAKLPDGTVMRLSFLAGATTARIEVTRMENREIGTDLRAHQRTARHVGHSGWLLEVRDLDAAVARAAELGGTVHTAPHTGPEALFGGRAVAFLDTPNGLPVTFVQAP